MELPRTSNAHFPCATLCSKTFEDLRRAAVTWCWWLLVTAFDFRNFSDHSLTLQYRVNSKLRFSLWAIRKADYITNGVLYYFNPLLLRMLRSYNRVQFTEWMSLVLCNQSPVCWKYDFRNDEHLIWARRLLLILEPIQKPWVNYSMILNWKYWEGS